MSAISFNNADVSFRVNGKRKINKLLTSLFINEKKKLQVLSIIFCSDDYLLELNKTYLNHDYYTDILTFDLSDGPTEINGELYISIDRTKENAVTLKGDFTDEIYRVIIHGALHLCGYKDKTTAQIKKIREKEDFYLSLLKDVSRGTF